MSPAANQRDVRAVAETPARTPALRRAADTDRAREMCPATCPGPAGLGAPSEVELDAAVVAPAEHVVVPGHGVACPVVQRAGPYAVRVAVEQVVDAEGQ